MRRWLSAHLVPVAAAVSLASCGGAADRAPAPPDARSQAASSLALTAPAASYPGELARSELVEIARRYAVGYSIDPEATPPRLLGVARSGPADAMIRAGADAPDPSLPDPATEMVVFGGFFVVSAPGAEAHFHYAIFSQLSTTGEILSTLMSDHPPALSRQSIGGH